MKTLTIGQVTGVAGLGVGRVRFYERKGLLAVPARRDSAVAFRQAGQIAGVHPERDSELLELRADPQTGSADVRWRAETKFGDMETRIQDLERIKAALRKGHAPIDTCPILR